MKKIELSGKISWDNGGSYFDKIKLIQPDEYKIDLVGRLNEAIGSYTGTTFGIRYYISDKPCSLLEASVWFLRQMIGDMEADYSAEEYNYSEHTNGVNYNTSLKVCGHDLFSELCKKLGKYLCLEITIHD